MKLSTRVVLLTFLGGALGTLLRYLVLLQIDGVLAIALINLLGAAAIGVFNGHRFFHTDTRRAFYSIGFAGGFTTLSSMLLAFNSPDWALVIVEVVLGIGVYLFARHFSARGKNA